MEGLIMKKLKAFILTAMITFMFGTSVINAYETYIPVSIRYEKTDSNGDGVEDSITILYDKTYATAESVIIPDRIDGLPVTEISPYAFSESQITSIKLPGSLEKIEEAAFMLCENLKNIELPESVKYICENAFNSCTAVESIRILNPECEIYDSSFTLFQFTGTIYGYENSTAQEYAEKYDYNFSVIDAEPAVTTSAETTAVTTSEDAVTTVSQTKMTTPEETQVSQIETSVSQVTTSEAAITTVSVVTTPEITKRTDEHGNIVITVGDVNDDGRVSALDAAIIARKLAEGRSSDLNKWAADYNGDGKVTALDCSEIARFLAKVSIIEHTTAPNENKTETTKTTVKLKEPNKKNYDLNKFSGIKKYVNDCIKYKAAAEYGITKIIYDDTVDPWDGYSWNVPADYIPNIEYYKEHNDPILPAGILWTADELVEDSYTELYMMVEEEKASLMIHHGYSEKEVKEIISTYYDITVTWKELGGGNYQLYIMW
jgi:hypothetical protein